MANCSACPHSLRSSPAAARRSPWPARPAARSGVPDPRCGASSAPPHQSLLFDPHPTLRFELQCDKFIVITWRCSQMIASLRPQLLVVFERSCRTAAYAGGKRLGMSQPALSHALNRLRYSGEGSVVHPQPRPGWCRHLAPSSWRCRCPCPRGNAAGLEPETFGPRRRTDAFRSPSTNYGRDRHGRAAWWPPLRGGSLVHSIFGPAELSTSSIFSTAARSTSPSDVRHVGERFGSAACSRIVSRRDAPGTHGRSEQALARPSARLGARGDLVER